MAQTIRHVGPDRRRRRRRARTSCSWSTRSSATWVRGEMSPISSRKSVPPSASSKRPRRRAAAPVNEPFSCPKSSERSSVSTERGAVDLDEGPRAPRARLVDRLGDELLARAALAVDEHGGVGLRRPCGWPWRARHRRRAPHHPPQRGRRRVPGPRRAREGGPGARSYRAPAAAIARRGRRGQRERGSGAQPPSRRSLPSSARSRRARKRLRRSSGSESAIWSRERRGQVEVGARDHAPSPSIAAAWWQSRCASRRAPDPPRRAPSPAPPPPRRRRARPRPARTPPSSTATHGALARRLHRERRLPERGPGRRQVPVLERDPGREPEALAEALAVPGPVGVAERHRELGGGLHRPPPLQVDERRRVRRSARRGPPTSPARTPAGRTPASARRRSPSRAGASAPPGW